MTRRSRLPTRGFTLIEMVVVLIIIGIGMAVVVPMVDAGFDSREVRRAAREIAATMRHCRVESVSSGEPLALFIDADRNMIATSDGGRWAVLTERAVIEDIVGGTLTVDGSVQITFFPNGASSGAAVVVASRRDRTRMRLTVKLDPLLSDVKVGQDA